MRQPSEDAPQQGYVAIAGTGLPQQVPFRGVRWVTVTYECGSGGAVGLRQAGLILRGKEGFPRAVQRPGGAPPG